MPDLDATNGEAVRLGVVIAIDARIGRIHVTVPGIGAGLR